MLAARAHWRQRVVAYGRVAPEPAGLAPALIATLHDPAVIRKILAHLGMAGSGPSPGPASPESGGVAP